MEKCKFYKKINKFVPSKEKGCDHNHDFSFYYCSHMCAHMEISASRNIVTGSNNNLTCGGDIENNCQCDFSSLYSE